MNIQWHPGFYGAAELEFLSNKGDLEFQREFNLSKEPIRMDLLIIKKLADVRIENELGHIFKKYNAAEYKSPDDALFIYKRKLLSKRDLGTADGFQREAVSQACGLCNSLFGRHGSFHLPQKCGNVQNAAVHLRIPIRSITAVKLRKQLKNI